MVLDGSSFWADGKRHYCILYSTDNSSLPENKDTIRTTRMYNLFQSLNVINQIIIVLIHSWLVSMVNERESHMLHHGNACYRLFYSLEILISTVQIC